MKYVMNDKNTSCTNSFHFSLSNSYSLVCFDCGRYSVKSSKRGIAKFSEVHSRLPPRSKRFHSSR